MRAKKVYEVQNFEQPGEGNVYDKMNLGRTMVRDLEQSYYVFGNKGALWSDAAHIAQSGTFSGETLCGTPMLSSNACKGVEEIGCEDCKKIYRNR